MKLAEHYYQRFELGLDRMKRKKRDMLKERVGAFGGGDQEETDFGLGEARAPYPYGRPY